LAYGLSSAVRPGGTLEEEERSLLAACIAGVMANGIGNLVSFDVIATAMAAWVLMAVGVSLALRRRDAAPLIAPGPVVLSPGRLGLVAVVWLVIGGAMIQFNVRPLAADVYHRTALRSSVHSSATAVRAAHHAALWWPLEPAHHLLLGRLHPQRALETGDAGLLAEAETALMRARDLRPQDPGVWVELGAFYHAAGAMWDAGAFPLAHQAYHQAVSLTPNHARLYLAWGQVYLTQDRPEEALARFYRAYDLDATDGLALRLIGDIELALGRPEVAHAAYQEALRWSPDAALVYLGLARSHAALGQPEAAALALARAEELAPDHPAVQAVRQQWDLAP
jgi:tetratricopeptide (TPR) repeat protein